MFVEFTGIAGVGKSTLFNEVCKTLKKREIPYDNLKLVKVKKINLSNILTILKTLYMTLLIRPKTLVGFKKTFCNMTSYQIRCNSANEIYDLHISDEGIFHKIREFNRNSNEINMIEIAEKLFKYINVPDFVIVVEASVKRIYERRTNRNRKNDVFNYEDIEKSVSNLPQTIEVIEFTKKKFSNNLRMLKINNNNDYKINVEQIVDVLEKYWTDIQ